MHCEKVGLEIYVFVIHANTSYHCILFEDKELKMVLPFEAEIENVIYRSPK